MIAQYLWETGSAIIGLMGLSHLRATLWTNKLFPRNEKLIEEMKDASLLISEKLMMWKSWIGFNATHSSGIAFIGIVNFYLALNCFTFLRSNQFLLLLTILTVGFYVWVAWRYWLRVVLVMLSVAWGAFITAYIQMFI
ncbi:hypothetical protein FHW36_112113 [Chitinophaga polysaccharea]|uniref:Uncharacterized protein n=1 Tax=Chitinophaga polysaccharea TaxID=1293035 RepID=A0A561P6D3_9BACT|nr:hypothetical protein [Chitinophaga polysaccharea]TWF33672.1 hypothetical protein FHW36_112113 [Chitinophaga polysaccharea]